MEEKYKGGLYEAIGEPKKSPKKIKVTIFTKTGRHKADAVKVYTQKCSLKIAIPGKTFKQVKAKAERALYTPKVHFKQIRVIGDLRTLTLARIKSPHRVSIKTFLQEELNSYCNNYIKKNNLQIVFHTYIENYEEHAGCIETNFDLVVCMAKTILDESTRELVRSLILPLIAKFIPHVMGELKKRIDPKNRSNCSVEDISNKKDDKIPPPDDNK